MSGMVYIGVLCQALPNTGDCESVNASVIKQSRPRTKLRRMGLVLGSDSCEVSFVFDRNAHISRYRQNFSFREANSFQRGIVKRAHTQNNDSLNRYPSS